MIKLTQKDKCKITSDWKSVYPSYHKYKNLQLVKRYGPLIFGIYLKPVYGEEHYVPVFFINSLLTPMNALSLNVQKSLINTKNVEDSISLIKHNKDFYNLSIKFTQQVLLLNINNITFSNIQDYYKNCIRTESGYPIQAITDYLNFLLWCEKKELFQQELNYYYDFIKHFPADIQFSFKLNFKDLMDNYSLNVTNKIIDDNLNRFNLIDLIENKIILE